MNFDTWWQKKGCYHQHLDSKADLARKAFNDMKEEYDKLNEEYTRFKDRITNFGGDCNDAYNLINDLAKYF